jgi:hypothetical protein
LAQRTYLILFRVGFSALFRGFSQIMLALASATHARRLRRSILRPADQTDLQGRRRHRGIFIATSSFSADAARGVPTTRRRNVAALAA